MELFRERICRTCRTIAKQNVMLCSIYYTATDTEDTTIADLLTGTIPTIHIELNDDLPKNICLSCLETLLMLNKFQKMCLKSQFELLAMGATAEISLLESLTKRENNRNEIEESINLVVPVEDRTSPDDVADISGNDSVQSEENQIFEKKPETITTKNKYAGKYCDKGFTSQKSLLAHERHHRKRKTKKSSGEKRYECPVCHKIFNRQSSLCNHKKIHTDNKKFSCDECDAAFRLRGNLKTHKQTHSNQRLYECPVCHKIFNRQSSLCHHRNICKIAENIIPTKKLFDCSHCDKRFKQKRNLTAHQLSHSFSIRYKCKYCEKSYARQRDLTRHLKNHNGNNTSEKA